MPVNTWLNQIEIYFSIVQRKALAPNDFTNIDEVIDRLNHFEARYNQTATPFKWKFTTTDLDDLLNRLDNHTPESGHDPAHPHVLTPAARGTPLGSRQPWPPIPVDRYGAASGRYRCENAVSALWATYYGVDRVIAAKVDANNRDPSDTARSWLRSWRRST